MNKIPIDSLTMAVRESMPMVGGETKPKVVYTAGCTLILHYFAGEHISASGTVLIAVIS